MNNSRIWRVRGAISRWAVADSELPSCERPGAEAFSTALGKSGCQADLCEIAPRNHITIRRSPDPNVNTGPAQQVQRMGNSLINELIIGVNNALNGCP